ncbi:MAG: hypothetical protein P4M11_14705 [Candidatus Pacebacteria bacterium]|nr:hypothetical protein [Candidatus Paceibacterota bacterium]
MGSISTGNNPTSILIRLALTAIVLAIKYQEDSYRDNAFYSKVGGISLFELNCLEIEMLTLLRFELYVHPRLFRQYAEEIARNAEEMRVEEAAGCCAQAACANCYEENDVRMETEGTMPSTAELVE